ncbi:MAG: hypothetical protein ACOCUV_00685 [bacterium]
MNKVENEILSKIYASVLLTREQRIKIANDVKKFSPCLSKNPGYLIVNNQEVKIPRFLNKKLKINSDEEIIKTISEDIKLSLWDIKYDVKYLTGYDVTMAYQNAVGNHSCMTGEDSEYTRLYEMNPDKVGLLVAKYNKNSARCLLWKMDNGKFYADKIYANHRTAKDKLLEYCKNKDCECYNLSDKPSDIVSGLVYVNGHVPYMDTFAYAEIVDESINDSEGEINLSWKRLPGFSIFLDRTDGLIGDIYSCENCGWSSICEEDVIYHDGCIWCEACFDEHFMRCYSCDEIFSIDDLVFCELEGTNYCEYCYFEEFTRCERCDNETYIEDLQHAHNWQMDVCPDCFCEYEQELIDNEGDNENV